MSFKKSVLEISLKVHFPANCSNELEIFHSWIPFNISNFPLSYFYFLICILFSSLSLSVRHQFLVHHQYVPSAKYVLLHQHVHHHLLLFALRLNLFIYRHPIVIVALQMLPRAVMFLLEAPWAVMPFLEVEASVSWDYKISDFKMLNSFQQHSNSH